MVSRGAGLFATTLIAVLAVAGILPAPSPPVRILASESGPADSRGLTVVQDHEGWLWREGVDPVPNRYLAFGDSITYGEYSDYPYPAQLEAKLDLRVADSEVINSGNPGEGTFGGSERITGEVSDHQPRYVLIIEGTNDVSRDKPPAEVYDHLLTMIDNARITAGVNDVQVMLATIIPRRDDRNDETFTMNQEAVIPAANNRHVPICDQWQAFYNFGPWQSLYEDDTHPNVAGLQLIANTFYDCLITTYPEVKEETTPPTTWIESVPSAVECGQAAPVSWNGSDNLNWVVDYDVQVQVKGGEWTDWLVATQKTSGAYTDTGIYGLYGFRVRGRDLLGNQSDYSAPKFTQVTDSVPPYQAGVDPLPPAQVAPLAVSWWGMDACAAVVAYDVQYRVGVAGAWQEWLTGTATTRGSFTPSPAQYGEIYSFRARAEDEAGNWSNWSGPGDACTQLARFSVAGHAYNVRHQPLAGADVNLNPAAAWTTSQPGGGFSAYVTAGGDYELTAERPDVFGPLPPIKVAVNDHVSGLELILPPQDEAVRDGGFEASSLGAWQMGGTLVPTLTHTAHTGLGAVQLGGVDGDSHLGQVISLPSTSTDPTLSFLVRLAEAGPPSTLEVELAGAGRLSSTLTDVLTVEDEQWTHAWYDLAGWVGEPLTLTFTVSHSPAILLDEVSLGSALKGGYPVYLPLAHRKWQ